MRTKKEKAALIDSQLEKSPDMQITERAIFVLLLSFVVLRILPAVIQTFYVASVKSMRIDCLMNYILVILSALFAVMIAQGVKFFTILGMLCGVYSLVALWLDLNFRGGSSIGSGILFTVYLVSLVSVCVIQIGIMLYILISKKCGAYLDLLDGVNKEYFEDGNLYTDD